MAVLPEGVGVVVETLPVPSRQVLQDLVHVRLLEVMELLLSKEVKLFMSHHFSELRYKLFNDVKVAIVEEPVLLELLHELADGAVRLQEANLEQLVVVPAPLCRVHLEPLVKGGDGRAIDQEGQDHDARSVETDPLSVEGVGAQLPLAGGDGGHGEANGASEAAVYADDGLLPSEAVAHPAQKRPEHEYDKGARDVNCDVEQEQLPKVTPQDVRLCHELVADYACNDEDALVRDQRQELHD
mmetsp:Transcript_74703/g.218946  ORF Transcript_74703/g.218946 Transcript_74703/m.218946 type:complete len:241 (+) Transcript_74703:1103-1825(+)